MDNLLITQLSTDDIKTLFFESLKEFFRDGSMQKTADEKDEINGIELAVEITKLSKSTIYSLVSKRQIPHSKKGKRLYFSRTDLLEWIKNGKRKTKSELLNIS